MRGRQALARGGMAVVVVIALLALAACAAPSTNNTTTSNKTSGGATTSAGAAGGVKVALLLPESKTARYETQDRPLFEKNLKALIPNVQILYSNANQDATQQQSQAEAAITNGAKVLVLDPVDSASAASIVKKANAAGVPVLSYDRLILNSKINGYVSFDNERVGQLQAAALLARLKAMGKTNPKIVMINGSPTDNNATQFKKGAHSVLDGKAQIVAEYDTPDWSPDQAQTEMDQAITKVGKAGFDGVYAANDGTGGGAIAAMKGAGIDPSTRPTTGQDAELAAIQRILLGEQYMTVYKAIKLEAAAAAQMAAALAKGQPVPSSLATSTVNNKLTQVAAVLLPPVAVNKSNIQDTVVKDGFWTVQQIESTPQLKAAGQAAGLH